MRAASIITLRLNQYAALWLGSFLLMLGLAAAACLVGPLDLVDLADAALPAAFLALGAAVAFGAGATALSSASLTAKVTVVALALLLVLPLLWAPVLAVLAIAALDGSAIEYSRAYAQFRIAVSQLTYPLLALVVEGPLISAAWKAFQVVASVIGFLASLLQVWKVARGLLAGRPEPEPEGFN